MLNRWDLFFIAIVGYGAKYTSKNPKIDEVNDEYNILIKTILNMHI